ncbi:D-aminoacyl-tRNA deacylase [Lacimicrobium alkaliphilum]|uniref:D-aminoacyl-tRNA deacylase n=1 Tax=Lacimicrobium alkaliphilum TaxID=1526571 RepID=A0ABQ1R647_9ALTE|nr:D-aminoacyl-tRNA deacylase [Lacimicrobium alkaliphilum]GGD59435.1 D-aminoacyl-tRNA deacylase [Lacimicrobium alkaliphilum]
MIGLLQRVTHADVRVDDEVVGKIGPGIMLLLGVEKGDDQAKAERLCERVLNYRMFNDEQGKMNLSLRQTGGELLVVSQFTLVADTQKGNRPGFSRGGDPHTSRALYEYFIEKAGAAGIHCESGCFGADMRVSLTNDGPVTFQLSV